MVWILVFLALLSTAEGKPRMYARHVATVVSVYDGDTFTVDVVLWPGLTWRGKVRVRGVDTPEIQTKSKKEKKRALLARDFVRARIGKTVFLENVKQGSFSGRVVATVRLPDGSNLAKILIRKGHGKAYKRRR